VQPTILMTEEGAIDSGIGELMSQVAGPQGQEMGPQMTQGLGELMAAGQPEMPVPVQNFQQGSGPGGVRSPRAYMEEYLPLYEEIMGSSEEADRRRLNLDIASAGFNLASGRDPRTGENIAGRPFLSQLGTALDPIAKGQGERIAAQRKADQAARLAALQSGLSARESDMALLTEAAKAQRDRRIDLKELTFDLAGNKVRTYIDGNDPGSLNFIRTLNNPKITDLSSQADAPKPSPHLAINKDGSFSLVDLSTGAGVQSTQKAMAAGDVVDLIQIGSANQQKTPKWFNVTDSQGNSRVLNLNDEAHQNQLDTMQKEGRVTVEGVGTQQTSTTADVYEMTLTDGSSINLDLNNPDDRKKWNQLNEDKQIELMFTVGARPTAERRQFENVKVTTIGGEELFLNLAEDKDRVTFKRLQGDGTIKQVEKIGTASSGDERDNVFGRGREGLVMELLSDEAAMTAWGNNAAEGAEGQQTNRNIEAALVDYLTPQTVYDPESGLQVKKTNPPTPLMITSYEQRKRVDPTYRLPVMETALTKAKPLAGDEKDATDAPEPYPEDSAWEQLEAGEIDPTRATGTNAWIANVLNTLTGVVEDLGVESAYPGAEKLQAALKVLNTETVMVFKEANEGRENRPIDDMIRELSPDTATWTMSDKRSLEKWRSLRGMFGEAKAQLDDQLKDPNLTQDKRVQKEWALRKTDDLIRKYDTLIRWMEPAIATQSGQAEDIDLNDPKYSIQ